MLKSDCVTAASIQQQEKIASNGMFLLIDASQFPGIWRILQYRFRRLEWVSLHDNPAQVASGPVLIHVTANQTRTLAWFLEHTQSQHCLSWLVSLVDLTKLREHLRSLTRVTTEDGSRYPMRFYDTRILPAWYQMLDHKQEAHVLAPIESWAYMDREHMPCTLFGQAQAAIPAPYTLTLTRDQEKILLVASMPDLVMQRLSQNGNADLAAMPEAKRYAFIADQVHKATKQYGIYSIQEVVLFCSLALGIGRNFDKLLPVTQVLQRFANAHAANSYRSLLNA
jgi:hypothetical protein